MTSEKIERLEQQGAAALCSPPDASPKLDQLATALVAAQNEMPAVAKSKRADVKTRKGPNYGYAYTSIGDVLADVTPVMARHGLAILQRLHGQDCETILLHVSGQWIQSTTPIPFRGGTPQEFGSATTYVRRYALCALLAIPVVDDDAAAASRRAGSATTPVAAPPAPDVERSAIQAEPAVAIPGPYGHSDPWHDPEDQIPGEPPNGSFVETYQQQLAGSTTIPEIGAIQRHVMALEWNEQEKGTIKESILGAITRVINAQTSHDGLIAVGRALDQLGLPPPVKTQLGAVWQARHKTLTEVAA